MINARYQMDTEGQYEISDGMEIKLGTILRILEDKLHVNRTSHESNTKVYCLKFQTQSHALILTSLANLGEHIY